MYNEDIYNYIFGTEDDAWDVIGRMNRMAEDYGRCTKSDFFHIIGAGGSANDHRIGWCDPSNATVERDQHGWHICIEDPENLY